jgi:hypothetical protein
MRVLVLVVLLTAAVVLVLTAVLPAIPATVDRTMATGPATAAAA